MEKGYLIPTQTRYVSDHRFLMCLMQVLYDGERVEIPQNQELRTRILAECHDDTTGAHFGRDKTMAAVQRRCTWPGLAADVERYVATCDSCQEYSHVGKSLIGYFSASV